MPGQLKELIDKVNGSDDDKISCALADISLGLAFDVAAELGIPTAGLWPASMFQLMFFLRIPKLIEDGLIDDNGTPLMKHKMFQLSPMTPVVHPMNFAWLNFGNSPSTQKFMFDFLRLINNKAEETADWVLYNSSSELEPQACNLVPKVLPIGPLSATNRVGNLSGNFWSKDPTCLQWLNQQSPSSVIYVAFGSSTVFDEIQFQELALGLELTKKPFLRVVREDIIKGKHQFYPQGFKERVSNQGKIVCWAPQVAVLGHSSIACFISHCGWNSTIEGVSNGVPFLCWPYFFDQFLNESYIYDIWKVGLKLERDERGTIRKEEIRTKVEQLVGDENFKTRVVELKQMVTKSVGEGGNSDKTFKNFVDWLKSYIK
ncbi:hypothetical protein ES319_D11G142600v1 [Gossypium barbadense]|uniref:UDP-glycosyltransferases domain-containing protein n=1 Tax=Gossypium barbadense TaxID=3634 RepID=A0A5J5PEW4_GOSBA|nr:hypothetical protein ES319_D11G142600v1 [Gossypium barbadense]